MILRHLVSSARLSLGGPILAMMLAGMLAGGTLSCAGQASPINRGNAEAPAFEIESHVYDVRDLLAKAANRVSEQSDSLADHRADPGAPLAADRAELVKQLTQFVEETIAPNSWKDRGGAVAEMRESQGWLTIIQTRENQIAIQNLLVGLHQSFELQRRGNR